MADSPFAISSAERTHAPARFRPSKMFIVVSVVVAVTVAVILTGVLVGVNRSTDEEKDIMRFSYKPNASTTEEMMSDPNTNIVEYHVSVSSGDPMNAWIINDFDRGLQVMKIITGSDTECFVTPLNRTMAKEPATMTLPTEKELRNVSMTTMSYDLVYHSRIAPILDLGFVSQRARDACKKFPTYWIFPSVEDSADGGGRQKRLVGIISLFVTTVGVVYQIVDFHRRRSK